MDEWKNQLFYGDNLPIMRDYISDEMVDLVYLDPPFNSKATYNLLFQEKNGTQSAAQFETFSDFWVWDRKSEETYWDVVENTGNEKLSKLLQALREFLGENDMLAYIVMLSARLVELRRVLKKTGSLYLHCDSVASHYIKLVLDSIFGIQNFKNEIIWRRTGSNNSAKKFGPIHQTIFYYVRSKETPFYLEKARSPYTVEYVEKFFKESDEKGRYQSVALTGPGTRTGESGKPWHGYDPTDVGRHWQPASYLYETYSDLTGEDLAQYGLIERLAKLDEANLIHWGKSGATVPRYKFHLSEAPGVPYQDIWAYQPGTRGCVYERPEEGIDQDVMWLSTKDAERLGYQTQKPEGLLERIIAASSKEGDVVLDPFAGCGTTINVAERLHRRWIAIDITYLAVNVMKRRLEDAFGSELSEYDVIGNPTDVPGARELAEHDRYQFQWWALDLVGARLVGGEKKKGSDKGIDGVLYFHDEASRRSKQIIISVKSGKVQAKDIRDLKGVLDREKESVIGVLITLQTPTKPMLGEVYSAGNYQHPAYPDTRYPKIQILTVEELLGGKQIDCPRFGTKTTYKKAVRKPKPKADEPEQRPLLSEEENTV